MRVTVVSSKTRAVVQRRTSNMMFLSFLVLCTGLVVGAWGASVDDFDDPYRHFEFIYHEHHNLLLAIHSSNCYFVYVPPSEESQLDGNGQWIWPPLKHTEEQFFTTIRNGEATRTTLSAMRDKYHDLLADFHCLDSHIFEVDLFEVSGNPSHSTEGNSCHGLSDGLHSFPPDCHWFLSCANGFGAPEECADGNVWNPQIRNCDWAQNVPGCH